MSHDATEAAPEWILKRFINNELPFQEFMRIALYDPIHGYYSTTRDPIGAGGDFVTSPSISPAFGHALGMLAIEFLARAGDEVCSIVDIGCGDGSLIAEIYGAVAALPSPARCIGVDRSLARVPEPLLKGGEITFLDVPGEIPRGGPLLIISNELFDAFPVARLVHRAEGLRELVVSEEDGFLRWRERRASEAFVSYFAERRIALAIGQFADISLEWEAKYEELARLVTRGLIVTFDYGFEPQQLFDPRIRRYGTVAAYSAHQVSRNVLDRPGDQDLTAHVNFGDLRNAGERSGLDTLLFTRQARFLLSLGITEHPLFQPSHEVESNGLEESIAILEERQRAQRLVLPDGIGEEMRVLVQGRGLGDAPWSFQRSRI